MVWRVRPTHPSGFLANRTYSANQIEFINLIINQLTRHGIMDAGQLYTSPYTDLNPSGVEGIFKSAEVDQLIGILDDIRKHAIA